MGEKNVSLAGVGWCPKCGDKIPRRGLFWTVAFFNDDEKK